jgi:hypothetical protein
METSVETTKVTKISRQPTPGQITKIKSLNNVEYLGSLSSITTKDVLVK